ncbi:MAG: divergent PAP2 family protein [Heyndrickxia sp.]
MSLFSNYPLIAAFTSIIFAQVVKVPLYFITNRSWNVGLAFSSGSMPSSHSAAVASLSTAVGILDGVSSTPFAIAVVFSAIIMFDAAGVRRHAGNQAIALNRLIIEFNEFVQEMRAKPKNSPQEQREALKELLGHRPIEVFVGAIVGICISFILYFIYF